MSSLLRRPTRADDGRLAPAADGPAGAEHEATFTVGLLADNDRPSLRRLVEADPLVNVVLAARLDAVATMTPRRLGGSVIGVRDTSHRLVAAAFHGGNLLPVGGDAASWSVLGRRLARDARLCTSIVGRADTVSALWSQLSGRWGTARLVREQQPLLTRSDTTRLGPRDPGVRMVRPHELDAYLPAAEAMFTEELGVSPYRGTSGDDYRRRVAASIRDGRAFARFDESGGVIFKADFGAVSSATCQVQGVWVRPDLRGSGVGTRAMASVLAYALDVAPNVSLYVNGFNIPARRMYDRLGMRQVDTLSTVLF